MSVSEVSYAVLDEADRMWDMGFKDDVGKIVKACPKDRQTLLFSATITPELADFSEKHMKAPVEVLVDNYVDASKLKQIYYDVQDNLKFSLLVHLLKNEKPIKSRIKRRRRKRRKRNIEHTVYNGDQYIMEML